jgi:hypothetical protein
MAKFSDSALTFANIENILGSLVNQVEYDESDAADYGGGVLSPDLSETTIDISGQSLTDPVVDFAVMCSHIVWVESITASTITIGIGDGAAEAIKFKLTVRERFTP